MRDGESAEGKFVGRNMRYTPEGIEWEADPKQVTSLIAEFWIKDCSGVDTPGVRAEVEGEGEKMASGDASEFMRAAAKLNDLACARYGCHCVCF